MVRAQGGYVTGWGGQQVPLMNNFFGGPTMVRGFAPNGFGPRDLTPGTTMDNVGGSAYWATTAELQSAIPGVPNEYGLRATAFVDAGSVFRYSGSTASLQVANKNVVRSSVGAGPDLGLAVRRIDRRLRRTAKQGCLRRRAASAIQRGRVLTGTGCSVANPYNSASRSRHSRNRLEK
jgi:outer membrane protein assembly factor BamA